MKRLSPAVKRITAALVLFARDRRGATATEYGLILAFVFLALLVGVTGVGTETSRMWSFVSGSVSNAR
jgi:pilus assembly protein Flp/PilA